MMRAALLLAGALVPAAAVAAPALAPVWTDHAVVQRGKPIVVEGAAEPLAEITATLGTETWRGRAGRDGRFSATFAARDASSEPLVLTVADGAETVMVSDIVVGEVWLCSGQSNMEWPVSASTGGGAAIQGSADPGLRLLQIPKETAAAPQRAFSQAVAWAPAAPQSTPAFSAACYYMARQLRQDLGVPVGAIHASWGGSQIRAWLTPRAGVALYGEEQMGLLADFDEDPLGATTRFAPTWEAWWREGTGGQEPWNNPDALEWTPVPAITAWPGWAGTRLAEDPIGNVWFRRTLTLTPAQAEVGGTLSIGVIDDMDTTWVNGRIVGNTFGWSNERRYPIPAGYLKAGDNEIVFAASNSWGPGGFQSTADKLSFEVAGGETIALGEGWRYSIGALREMPPRAPWDGNAGIGVMHNRMVAPLGQIALAGAAWYQGESDVGVPGYADRLRELFAGWRRQFGDDMRMLVVQLPNFGERSDRPVDAGWAQIREEQRRAVAADGNAALITTLDVGLDGDLHPPNKLPVGLRLAMAAQGKPMPMPQPFKVDGAYSVLIDGIEGRLHSWSGNRVLGFELCGESQDTCRYASAVATLNGVLIEDDGKPATRIRYAWSDAPVVNLTDGRGLPVPTFELPIER